MDESNKLRKLPFGGNLSEKDKFINIFKKKTSGENGEQIITIYALTETIEELYEIKCKTDCHEKIGFSWLYFNWIANLDPGDCVRVFENIRVNIPTHITIKIFLAYLIQDSVNSVKSNINILKTDFSNKFIGDMRELLLLNESTNFDVNKIDSRDGKLEQYVELIGYVSALKNEFGNYNMFKKNTWFRKQRDLELIKRKVRFAILAAESILPNGTSYALLRDEENLKQFINAIRGDHDHLIK